MFDEFWKLDWPAKKVFVKLLTRKANTARARDRKVNTSSRRKNSCTYYLKKGNNVVRVCKTMFLNTLAIGEWTALNWQNDSKDDDSTDDDSLPSGKSLRSQRLKRYENPRMLNHYKTFFLACLQLSHTIVVRGRLSYTLNPVSNQKGPCSCYIKISSAQGTMLLHYLNVYWQNVLKTTR